MRKLFIGIGGILLIAVLFTVTAGHRLADSQMNQLLDHRSARISDEAKRLHKTLTIMDWHSDTTLWERDFIGGTSYGHVDLPRLQAGNAAVMMMTAVTKSPSGQNYVENDGDSDRLTLLHMAQLRPIRTWSSLLERALYQSGRLDDYIQQSGRQMRWIKSKADLSALLEVRLKASNAGVQPPIGFLMGLEGGHALEGRLEHVDTLYDAGYRMIGLTHFFDNELGGSLHGQSKAGLTDFGRQVIRRLNEKNIILDMAHAAPKVAWEVMELTDRPFVISHTGIKGACDSPRNYDDALMQAIAYHGGLVAIGFWPGAICDNSPSGIARTIKYAVTLLGEDHVALGSDWDGSVFAIGADGLPAITSALMDAGLTDDQIRKVMGDNSLAFLARWLPDQ